MPSLRCAPPRGPETLALRCRALAAYGLLHFNAGRGVPSAEMDEALELERSLGDWPLPDGPTNVHGHQLGWSAEIESARTLFREVHDDGSIAERRRGRGGSAVVPGLRGVAGGKLGDRATTRGRVERADETARQALRRQRVPRNDRRGAPRSGSRRARPGPGGRGTRRVRGDGGHPLELPLGPRASSSCRAARRFRHCPI